MLDSWPARLSLLSCNALVSDGVTLVGVLGSIRVVCSDVEERSLLCGMFAQLGHLVDGTWNSVFLFALDPALCFVSLSLLARVFLLALGER